MRPWWWIIVVIIIFIVIIIVIRPPWFGGEKGITVVLSTTATKKVDPDPANLRRGTGVDHLRWDNQTGAEITLLFDGTRRWPFAEPKMDKIVIAAGAKSAWYTLDAAANGPFSYGTDPPLSGAPDEPVISAGD